MQKQIESKVRTPGAQEDPDPVKAEAFENPVTVDAGELKRLLAKLNHLTKEVQEAGKPKNLKAHLDAHLPDQSTVDPSMIKIPVLTRQGWVVPRV